MQQCYLILFVYSQTTNGPRTRYVKSDEDMIDINTSGSTERTGRQSEDEDVLSHCKYIYYNGCFKKRWKY